MKGKFITAVCATFVFAILYSWYMYVPQAEREASTYYFGFWEVIIFVVIYAGPIYLIAGIPLSYGGDKILQRFGHSESWKRWLLGILVYAGLGALAALITMPILLTAPTYSEMVGFAAMGSIAATLFYLIQLLLQRKRGLRHEAIVE